MACSLPFELLLFFLVALLSLALLLSIARNFLCPVHLCQTRRQPDMEEVNGRWSKSTADKLLLLRCRACRRMWGSSTA